ncbi:uncharacterized protein ASCRUDRAFT_80932 [Ascoidea rubescens DSM 1968]|uniref:Uncharacterized protein n=1 Tax=Ascoidea rubescens DSM 1968 TaxID=1344418 RepID=A0A1D2VI31_9ASCO|nr:hypothetical protein ASCRUDRAFT_80932 [Ascoidea rubescens DSM 1968]ODV61190.1 hypothetical protein ASCRUDRAFT_80932 [Ascoidea rubescens DSM 1968]
MLLERWKRNGGGIEADRVERAAIVPLNGESGNPAQKRWCKRRRWSSCRWRSWRLASRFAWSEELLVRSVAFCKKQLDRNGSNLDSKGMRFGSKQTSRGSQRRKQQIRVGTSVNTAERDAEEGERREEEAAVCASSSSSSSSSSSFPSSFSPSRPASASPASCTSLGDETGCASAAQPPKTSAPQQRCART